MEVVNRTGRLATEWEIALVQVVAARIAGSLDEESYADAGTSGWTTPESSPVSHSGSGANLRLRLGEHLSDQD